MQWYGVKGALRPGEIGTSSTRFNSAQKLSSYERSNISSVEELGEPSKSGNPVGAVTIGDRAGSPCRVAKPISPRGRHDCGVLSAGVLGNTYVE
ncbi:hypothetical protein C8035_v002555 [Colletotrichum spinosum]|uniref:Uncharacterized protein n=1 Tax=Colletotrichum spinosum TaxID=1347390 RepID=A0A4R8QGU5_9PEZI|nr:hypothetical protein C8035_v002555 [Colletotrichum spinosum]